MRIAVLTSGGDAPGMNAAIRMLVKVAIARGHTPLGVRDGFRGLVKGDFTTLSLTDVDGITRFGGTILGSARSREFRDPEGQERARAMLAEHGVDGLVVIGGNGSLCGAHHLAADGACRVVGLPASIDNDVGHTRTCIGVDTAVNTIVEACDRISDTATAHRRAFIVEVMGRESGFLAMRAGQACEADAILCRERGPHDGSMVAELGALLKRSFTGERGKRRVLIIKAEGVEIPTPVLAERLRGYLAIDDGPPVPIRTVVLGHVVRGGSPSQADRVIAQRMAFEALIGIEDGAHDVMMGWDAAIGETTDDPRIRRIPLAAVLEETERERRGTAPTTEHRVRLLGRSEPVLAL